MSGFHPYQAVLREQIEMRNLEEILERDDLKCQLKHRTQPNCSIDVTHTITSCAGTFFMCQFGAKYKTETREWVDCGDCGRPAIDHWIIRPI